MTPTGQTSQIFRSDGTPEGTVRIFFIVGRFGTGLGNLTIAGENLYFTTRLHTLTGAPPSAIRLLRATGTEPPVVVASATPAFTNSIGNLTPMGDQLFFTTEMPGGLGVELWKTDGTAAGTVLVKDINPGAASSTPSNLVHVDGTLYVVADDGQQGRELWRSDGTPEGTRLVKDINPGTSGAFGDFIGFLTNLNGTLFFSANNGPNGVELWRSDGTEKGTNLVADLVPGSDGSWPVHFTEFRGLAYFAAYTVDYGYELWASDGTAAARQVAVFIFRRPMPAAKSPNSPDM